MDDLAQAVALFNRVAMRDYGMEKHREDSLKVEWTNPVFDLKANTLAIFLPDHTMIAYGELWTQVPERLIIWSRVHPDHMNKGLATYLMGWYEKRAQELMPKAQDGARVVIQAHYKSGHEVTARLFKNHGYEPIREMYRMRIDMIEPPAQPTFPEGISVRTFRVPDDIRPMAIADTEAFRDHWGFVETPIEEFVEEIQSEIKEDPLFDPTLWFLAIDNQTGDIAGIALNRREGWDRAEVAYVQSLGVLRPYRRKGLGQALLEHSFRELFQRGQKSVTLGVDGDSLTGATRLYERVGMAIETQTTVYEKELRAGKEVMTQSVDAD